MAVLFHKNLISLFVCAICCAPSLAAASDWTHLMDDGHGADIVQDFTRAEVAYTAAVRLAQQSKDTDKAFYSMAHLLCAKIMLDKYADSEPLFQSFVQLTNTLKKSSQLDSDMTEEIDDVCDAYESCTTRMKRHHRNLPVDDVASIYEHSLQLRLLFLPDSHAMDDCLMELVAMRLQRKKFADALAALQKSLIHCDKTNLSHRASIEITMSCVYEKLGERDKAKALNRLARQEFTQAKEAGGYYRQLRWFYATVREPERARQLSSAAIEEYRKGSDYELLAEAYCDMAEDCFETKHYVESEKNAREAIALCKRYHLNVLIMTAYEILAESLDKMGRKEEARQTLQLDEAARRSARTREQQDFHDLTGDRNIPSSLRSPQQR